MNRRELAKNGFLALCGALIGKKVEETPETITITCSANSDGVWERKTLHPEYSLSDGTEIKHG